MMRKIGRHHHSNMDHFALDADQDLVYQIGQSVMTVDGYPGVVIGATSGPFDATYLVELDDGLGGGEYAEEQLSPIGETPIAAMATRREARDDPSDFGPTYCSWCGHSHAWDEQLGDRWGCDCDQCMCGESTRVYEQRLADGELPYRSARRYTDTPLVCDGCGATATHSTAGGKDGHTMRCPECAKQGKTARREWSEITLGDVTFEIQDTSHTWIAGRFDVVAYVKEMSHLAVGRMSVTEFEDGKWYVGNTAVVEPLRRRGISSAMLEQARRRIGGPVYFHDSEFTPDGAAWARSQGHTVTPDSGWRNGDMNNWIVGSKNVTGMYQGPPTGKVGRREAALAFDLSVLPPEMRKEYDKGWKAGYNGGTEDALEKADQRRVAREWYIGWHDAAAGNEKYSGFEEVIRHEAPHLLRREAARRTAARPDLPLLDPVEAEQQGLHIASQDYPEFEDILWERPDHVEAISAGRFAKAASKTAVVPDPSIIDPSIIPAQIKREYDKGWKAGLYPAEDALGSADRRGVSVEWKMGFNDAAAGETKYSAFWDPDWGAPALRNTASNVLVDYMDVMGDVTKRPGIVRQEIDGVSLVEYPDGERLMATEEQITYVDPFFDGMVIDPVRNARETPAIAIEAADEPDPIGKTLTDPNQPWWWRKVVGPSVKRVNDNLPDGYKMTDELSGMARNWCRFRTKDHHCMFPEQLDEEATRQAGYAVFIPKDRGVCKRPQWDQQRACPIGEPGPDSGEAVYGPDGTKTWWDGGQRYTVRRASRGDNGVPVELSRRTAAGKPIAEMTQSEYEALKPRLLYHATSRMEDLQTLLTQGVRMANVPMNLARQRYQQGEYAEFQPGAGVGMGLYASGEINTAAGFGRYIVAIEANPGDYVIPPESGSDYKMEWALRDANGVLINRDIPADRVHLVTDFHRYGNRDAWEIATDPRNGKQSSKTAAQVGSLTLTRSKSDSGRENISVDGVYVGWIYKGTDNLWYVRTTSPRGSDYGKRNYPSGQIVVNGHRTRREALEEFEFWLGRNSLLIDYLKADRDDWEKDFGPGSWEKMHEGAKTAALAADNPWNGEFEDGSIGRLSYVIQADGDQFAWGVYAGTRLSVKVTGTAASLDAARSAVESAAGGKTAAKHQLRDFERGQRVHIVGHPDEPGTVVSISGQGGAYQRGYIKISFDSDPDRHAQYPFREVVIISEGSKTAAWKDVREKAVRIRRDGGVRIIAHTGTTVTGEVRGDSDIYLASITRVPGTKQRAISTCSCKWEEYRWARSAPYKQYEGRHCAHLEALSYEIQAHEMFGGTIIEQSDAPTWRTHEPRQDRREGQEPVEHGVQVLDIEAALANVTEGGFDKESTLLALGNLSDSLLVAQETATASLLPTIVSMHEGLQEARNRISTVAFAAQVGGQVREVVGLWPDGAAEVEGVGRVPSSQIKYPTWDPTLGLTASKEAVMLGTGETATTLSGRQTTPFPKVDITSDRRTTNTLKRVNQWLVENARAEAGARGDRFNLTQFDNMDPSRLSQADKDSAHLYLFGDLGHTASKTAAIEWPSQIPAEHRSLLESFGVKIEVVPNGAGNAAQYDYARRTIMLKEGIGDPALIHEIGHALDHARGEISATPQWKAVWKSYFPSFRVQGMGRTHAQQEAELWASLYQHAVGDPARPIMQDPIPDDVLDIVRGTQTASSLGLSPKVRWGARQVLAAGSGVMVALSPSREICERLSTMAAEAGFTAESPDEIHLTLAYCGKTAEVDKDALMTAVRGFAAQSSFFTGKINGLGTFFNEGNGDETGVLWAAADIPGLAAARTALVEALKVQGIDVYADHDFTPHIAIAYQPGPVTEIPDASKISGTELMFTTIVAAYGGEWTHIDLVGSSGETTAVEQIEVAAAKTAVAGEWTPGGWKQIEEGVWTWHPEPGQRMENDSPIEMAILVDTATVNPSSATGNKAKSLFPSGRRFVWQQMPSGWFNAGLKPLKVEVQSGGADSFEQAKQDASTPSAKLQRLWEKHLADMAEQAEKQRQRFPDLYAARETKTAVVDGLFEYPEWNLKTATDYDQIDADWNRSYWSGQADAARARENAIQSIRDMKGQEVEVVKGRKVPVGTRGVVTWVGEGQWGWRARIRDASGEEHWIDVNNIELVSERVASRTAARETKFFVRFNGDDARIALNTDDYEEACAYAAKRSKNMDYGAWLGFAVFGPSGLIAVYKDGELSGYQQSDGKWISMEASKTAVVDGLFEDIAEAQTETEFEYAGLIIKALDTGRVLMTQRTPYYDDDPEDVRGRWEFPGGHMDAGETTVEAAIREFHEETGLSLPDGFEARAFVTNGPYMGLVVVVPNEAWTTNAELLMNETMGIGWFDIDQVPEIARVEVTEGDCLDIVAEASSSLEDGAPKFFAPRRSMHNDNPTDGTIHLDYECALNAARRSYNVRQGVWTPEDAVVSTAYAFGPKCKKCISSSAEASMSDAVDFLNENPRYMLDATMALYAEQEAAFASDDSMMFEPGDVTAMLLDEPEPALPETYGSDFAGTAPGEEPYEDEDGWHDQDGLHVGSNDSAGMDSPTFVDGNGTISSSGAFVPGDPRLSHLAEPDGRPHDNSDIAATARAFLQGPEMYKEALRAFSPSEQAALINEGADEHLGAANTDMLDIAGTHYDSTISDEDIFL